MKKPEHNPDIKVIKTATCKTISAKSILTYQIGADTNDEIHVRVHANSGGVGSSRTSGSPCRTSRPSWRNIWKTLP